MKSVAVLVPFGLLILAFSACGSSGSDFSPGYVVTPAPPPEIERPASETVGLANETNEQPTKPAVSAVQESDPITADKRPRIGAIAERAYIYEHPVAAGLALGYVRLGTSVPLISLEKIEGKDCARGYHKVAPRGYICVDPRKTTLDLDDPYYRALAELAPRYDVAFPYRYAFSNGAPMYSRVPTKDEQEKAERDLLPPGSFVQLAEWSRGHEELISTEKIGPTDPVPAIFANGKRAVGGGGAYDPNRLVWRFIPNGSMLAYGKAFEAEGRTWLVTPDLMIVPADRVRAFRRSTFHGVKLDNEVTLPLAWNRETTPIKRYSRDSSGQMVESSEAIPPKQAVQITGERVTLKRKTYWAIRGELNAFVADEDVTLTRTRKTLPRSISPGQKWIEAKINPGTLTAYIGDKPVFATLFSPGKGGAPAPGFDPYLNSMTKTGVFPIEWKDAVSVMSPDKEWPPKTLWFSEVPHIQYLRAPLAMHVSYWHEDFGNLKSAECLNVSPEDGAFLFGFTDPPMPEGWGGVRPGGGFGKATPVVVTAL